MNQSWQSKGNDAKHNREVNKSNIREIISVSVYLTVQRNTKNVNCNSFYDKKFNISDKIIENAGDSLMKIEVQQVTVFLYIYKFVCKIQGLLQ